MCPKLVQGVGISFSRITLFTRAFSYLRNDNDIDSDDNTVMITIISIMIMMTTAIMIQSCLVLYE